MNVRTISMLGAAAILLSGCAIAAKVQARRDYHKSVVTYQNCLAAHASDTGACEADRLSMLAAQREYDDFVAALTPGMMGTVNVATQHQ